MTVEGHHIPARYWYDGQYINNAREDAAEVALQRLRGAQVMRQQQQQQQMQGLGGQTSPGQASSYGAVGQQAGYSSGTTSPTPGGGQGRGGWGLYGSR